MGVLLVIHQYLIIRTKDQNMIQMCLSCALRNARYLLILNCLLRQNNSIMTRKRPRTQDRSFGQSWKGCIVSCMILVSNMHECVSRSYCICVLAYIGYDGEAHKDVSVRSWMQIKAIFFVFHAQLSFVHYACIMIKIQLRVLWTRILDPCLHGPWMLVWTAYPIHIPVGLLFFRSFWIGSTVYQ